MVYKNKNNFSILLLNLIPYVIIFFSFFISLKRCFFLSLYPDEMWFYHIIEINKNNYRFFMPNFLGYGSLWWNINKIFYDIFHAKSEYIPLNPYNDNSFLFDGNDYYIFDTKNKIYNYIFSSRIFSSFCLYSANLYIIYKQKDIISKILLSMICILPIFWFNGKWASPDFFCISICMLAFYLWLNGKKFSSVFFGIAFSLRLTNLLIFIPFILYSIAYKLKIKKYKDSLIIFFELLIGWIIGNPYFAFHPIETINLALGGESIQNESIHRRMILISRLIFHNDKQWDTVSTGSFLFWSGSVFLIISGVIVLMYSKKIKTLLFFLIGLFILTISIFFRGVGYGWYYMPIIPTFYMACVNYVYIVDNKLLRLTLSLLVSIGVTQSLVRSLSEIKVPYERSIAIKESKYDSCISSKLINKHRNIIYVADPVYIPSVLIGYNNLIPEFKYLLFNAKGNIYDENNDILIYSYKISKEMPFLYKTIDLAKKYDNSSQCGPFIISYPK